MGDCLFKTSSAGTVGRIGKLASDGYRARVATGIWNSWYSTAPHNFCRWKRGNGFWGWAGLGWGGEMMWLAWCLVRTAVCAPRVCQLMGGITAGLGDCGHKFSCGLRQLCC